MSLLEVYSVIAADGRYDNILPHNNGIMFSGVHGNAFVHISNNRIILEYQDHVWDEELIWDEDFPIEESIQEAMDWMLDELYEEMMS